MRQTVLITGANRGLGRALSDEYLGRGWRVYALVRNRKSEDAEDLERSGARVIYGELEADAVTFAVREMLEKDNVRLDLLVNNAGPPAATSGIEDGSVEEALEHFQVHCLGVLRVVRGVRDFLVKGETPLVVNISSRLGSISRMAEGMYGDIHSSIAYPVAKAAQNMLTVQLHRLLYPLGVRVVAVHPGALLTGYGSSDAATPVSEGAARLADLFDALGDISGVYLDPLGAVIPW